MSSFGMNKRTIPKRKAKPAVQLNAAPFTGLPVIKIDWHPFEASA
ncbi:hypothetical protein QPK24_14715 [Paenibacillus polygoni]|uniref:Uncharacterized protein n=1 Tax=Paenibacillus polygoni TaxID=3050112 RepID=A0ABY8WX99_9BACL|nr:hypothetical protein [Paenibacillus polygoni]WIV17672.1 hypothetical protein QPK24_14715 [Paenibacillus polygoni]